MFEACQGVNACSPQDDAPLRLGNWAELVGVPLADALSELLRLVDPDALVDDEADAELEEEADV